MTQFDMHLAAEGQPQHFRNLKAVYLNSEGVDTTDLSSVQWEANDGGTILLLQPQTDGSVNAITAGTGGLGSVDISYKAKATDGATPVDLQGSATITVLPAIVVTPISVTVDLVATDEADVQPAV